MSTVSSFDKVKRINERTKDLIHGFIRIYAETVMNDTQTIPPLIKSLCLLFFYAFIDSTILTEDEIQIFDQLLYKNDKYKHLGTNHSFKLIYKCSKDGFNATKWNKAVVGKQNVFFIIHTRDNNVFGGYTKQGYQSKYGNSEDEDAFLFLVRSSKNYEPAIFDITRKEKATWRTDYYMCCVGSCGCDLAIKDGADQHEKSWVDVDFQHKCYNIPSRAYLNGGKQYFAVIDIEVFMCVDHA